MKLCNGLGLLIGYDQALQNILGCNAMLLVVTTLFEIEGTMPYFQSI